MAIYAASDLHGYPLSRFKRLLEKVGFNDEDTLYILGDVIDRNGDGGVAMLRWIMDTPNVNMILGNHEDMLLKCGFLFNEITETSIDALGPADFKHYERYMRNGGGVTVDNLHRLRRREPEAIGDILDFLRELPLYAAVSVNNRDFILVHAGLGEFAPDKKLSEYLPFELLWTRPTLDTDYFDDIITVFGHTPSWYYGEELAGGVIRTRTWINIDAGAADGRTEPALLRLDDLEAVFNR